MAERLRGGQAAVRALEVNSVDTVFGIPGVHTLEIYDALVDSSITHILARHEQGAGFMADGYARASGRPGVAIIITGPGITNVATPVGEAFTDSVPVFVLSSNVERAWAGEMLGHLHDLKDQLGVMAAVTKWNDRAMDVASIPAMINRAFFEMQSGRPRPAHVEVPIDVLAEFGEVNVGPAIVPEAPEPSTSEVDRAVAEIDRAERIIIYAGGGAVSSGAGHAIDDLALRLGAPVVTSIMGKGSVSDRHPMALGHIWSEGNQVDQALRNADLAIVFGSKLGAQDTHYQAMPLPDRLIRVEIDRGEINRNYSPTLPILADARHAAEAFVTALRDRGIEKAGWSADDVRRIRDGALATAWGKEQRPYVDALRDAIPDDGILITDMTMMSYVCCSLYPVYEPRTFFFPSGYGTLGYSLPAALGAKVAAPDRTVVAIIGDGGFQYTMQEVATAVQFELGVPIVIFNDSTYTAVKEAQAREHDRRYIAVDLVNPDFLKLAEAYGIPGVRAETPEALTLAIREASRRDLPTIIDTPIRFEL
jgi:thiamine pyrophosphate-dependent acetolactate synthase large subunit-like protein